jgi:hypothetical protein
MSCFTKNDISDVINSKGIPVSKKREIFSCRIELDIEKDNNHLGYPLITKRGQRI